MILYSNGIKSKSVYINESQLCALKEDVFVSNLRGNKAKLSYNKRPSERATRNIGNYTSFDMLDTGKMDQNNHDTHIVRLKGGINSYNITSIKGTEVMHYFKNKASNKSTNIKLNVNGENSEYELMMEDSEFNEFLDVFCKKVSNVVNMVSKELSSSDKNFSGFRGVSIYPVPSSSNFNENMANILERYNIGISGLPCRKIDTRIFEKDLSDLQKDNDFIDKNKEYYNRRYYANDKSNNATHLDKINDVIRKFKNRTDSQDEMLVNNYNMWVNRVLSSYRQKVSPKRIAANYEKLVQAKEDIRKKLGKCWWDEAFEKIKYAKGPSVEARTIEIHKIVASVLGKTYVSANPIEIVEIRPKNFQIKTLTNDVRMGMQNYFKAQDNIEDELKRIEGTVFVIFDDNISGGATLSDICYQAKKLGINYIIPITFGVMREKYSTGRLKVDTPSKSWNY